MLGGFSSIGLHKSQKNPILVKVLQLCLREGNLRRPKDMRMAEKILEWRDMTRKKQDTDSICKKRA